LRLLKNQKPNVQYKIAELLGDKPNTCSTTVKTISKDSLHLPGPDFVDRIWTGRRPQPAGDAHLQALYNNGRLARTGYLSILPVDPGH